MTRRLQIIYAMAVTLAVVLADVLVSAPVGAQPNPSFMSCTAGDATVVEDLVSTTTPFEAWWYAHCEATFSVAQSYAACAAERVSDGLWWLRCRWFGTVGSAVAAAGREDWVCFITPRDEQNHTLDCRSR